MPEPKQDFKVTPWEVEGKVDYDKLIQQFGIEKFPNQKLKDAPTFMRRGLVFGSRDFAPILNQISKKEPFVVLTGLMPSGKFHIGHKMVADQLVYYQSLGAHIYLLVADIEAYNMRNKSLEELRETAIEEYLTNYIALGLKPKNCDFYFQGSRSHDAKKSNAYYRLAGLVSRKVTANEFQGIYGDLMPGKIVSVFTQIADILHPQLPEFGGPKHVVVPVGIDQQPHINLTREVASRMKEFGFIQPSATYHKFMVGLKGDKMSSSDPYSYIALTDSPEDAKHKIFKYAFSGGQDTVEKHRKLGGNPDVDVAFQMLYYMFEPDDKKMEKIREDYKSGKLLTGELKQIAVEKITAFLKDHQKKREQARKQVDKFLNLS